MSLSGRDKEHLNRPQRDKHAITDKEEAAKAAIKNAQDDIKTFTHLLNIRTITFKDLLTHKSLIAEHKRLIAEYAIYVEDMTKRIEKAKDEKKQAMCELKTIQAEAVVLRKASVTPVEKIQPATAPSVSFFRPHRNTFKDELMRDLKAYIARIGYYADEKGHIDFAHDFTIFPRSRAINRMANYLLAHSLLKQLQKGQPIYMVFSHVTKQRKVLILKRGLNNLEDYEERDIHSTTLNAIIDKANHYLVSEKQPLLAGWFNKNGK